MPDGLITSFETQATIEAQALAEGAERWLHKSHDAIDADLIDEDGATMTAMRLSIGRVAAALAKRKEELAVAGGRETLSKALIQELSADKMAYVGLLAAFSTALHASPSREAYAKIGSLLEVEVLAGHVDADAAERIALIARRSRSGKARIKAARKLLRDNTDDEPWSRSDRVKIGAVILDIVLSEVPEIETYINENGVECLTFTAEAADWLMQHRASEAFMHPLTPCMIVPPVDWSAVDKGGYLDERLQRLRPLCRSRHPEQRKLIQQHIDAGLMGKFLEALNTAQATPFTINRTVLAVQLEFKRRNISISTVPSSENVMLPVFPEDYETLPEEDQRAWRKKRQEARLRNIGLRSERMVYHSDLEEALRYAEHDRFWCPLSVDFRGRMYPIPTFNYQRSDPVKSLFLFADGLPLGEHGWKWLLIHAANVGDFDKVSKRSFADRVSWSKAHLDKMAEAAWDPLGNREWWTKADKPWQFLAACIEIAAVLEHGDRQTYVSRLPIALDGSNSGLQHYSAILRSYQDGMQVNLVPAETPADVYQAVADKLTAWVQRDADQGVTEALLWRNYGITRNLVKRGVMTYPYGSETFGMKQQIIEDTMKPIADALLQRKIAVHPFVDREQAKKAAGYLAKLLFKAVTQTVTKAQDGMAFLKKVAALLAHERKPVTWTTPLGFPVLHKYQDPIINRVDIVVSSRRIQVVVADGYKDTINKVSARNAVSPNVIHSCDATHVRKTVLAAKAEGITSYLLIHDSFATHAGNTERWSQIIREEMVTLYETWDPFQTVYDSAWAQLSEEGRAKLPTPPEKGALDLSLILQSPYAFA